MRLGQFCIAVAYCFVAFISAQTRASENAFIDNLPRDPCREICTFVVGPEPIFLKDIKSLLKLRVISPNWNAFVQERLRQYPQMVWCPRIMRDPNDLNLLSYLALNFRHCTKDALKKFQFNAESPLAHTLRSLDLRYVGLHQEQPKNLNVAALSLTHLDVSCSTIYPDTISYLATMPSLTSLVLARCGLKVAHLVPAIETFQSLEKLDCSHNQLTEPVVDSLAKLPRLKRLNIAHNLLDDKAAEKLTKIRPLTQLDIRENRISQKGVLSLTAIEQLRSLIIQRVVLDAEAVYRLSAHPGLTKLFLISCEIRSPHAVCLAQNNRLRSLDLSNNYLGEVDLEAFSHNTTLTSLTLDANKLDGSAVIPLMRNTTLRQLSLVNNSLLGLGAQWMFELTQLEFLNLSCNEINKLEEEFCIAPSTNLTSLNLSGNGLSKLPESLGSLANLRALDLSRNRLKEVKLIEGCKSLKKLALGYNNLPTAMEQELKERLTWLGELKL